MTITALQAAVTKTARFDGTGVDISALSGMWTLQIEVTALSETGGAPRAVFIVQDVEAADFTTPRQLAAFEVVGTIAAPNAKMFTLNWTERDSLPIGLATGKVRVSLDRLIGTSPSCTYRAWLVTN